MEAMSKIDNRFTEAEEKAMVADYERREAIKDAKHKAVGEIHKIGYWNHPKSGDDKFITRYFSSPQAALAFVEKKGLDREPGLIEYTKLA
jgi:hypothetical protein